MKIWFTEIGEPLPIEKNVRLHRYGQLTRLLAKMGHDVTWWTSSWSHFSKSHLVSGNQECEIDGVKLKIFEGPGYNRNVSLARIKHQADFALQFSAAAQSHALPDIIVTPIPTLEVAEAAVRFGRQHKVPVVVDIRDQWPDEFVDIAPKPLRWAAKIALRNAFRRARYICTNATGIMGVSRSFVDYGLSFSGRSISHLDRVIPIGYSGKQADPEAIAEAKAWWLANGLRPGAFICCYFGTIGRFFNLETVLKAARRLAPNMDIQVVLCGAGSSLAHYRKLAGNANYSLFPGWIDGPKISALMEYSKVGLAPYNAGARMALPNKPFEYFAGSLPVVSSLTGELSEILSRNECGYTYNPDSPEELAECLRKLHDAPELASAMGSRARKVLENEFEIQIVAKNFEDYLEKVIKSAGSQANSLN